MCRNVRYIVLLFQLPVALLCACQRHDTDLVETRHGTSRIEQVVEPVETPSQELVTIDSLMWRQPDSALACLIPYFDTCCRDAKFCVSTTTSFNRHYANLLLSELLYKNDYAQTNRPALLQAVAYFDSLVRQAPPFKGGGGIKKDLSQNDNLAFLDARAHYINGVGYYENDSIVPACAEYLKALEVMESRFEEKELTGHKAQFIALTYTRLTNLFSDLYLPEQTVFFAQLSLSYYSLFNAPLGHIVWLSIEIGSNYEIMEDYDNAELYYNQGLDLMTDTNNLAYRDIAAHLTFLSYKNVATKKSSALKQLNSLMARSQSEKEYLARCAVIGEIYYHEKQFDSSWIYLNKVFQESQSIDSKKQAAEWLVEIGKALGREDDIMEFASFLVPFATQDEEKGVIKSQLAELYNIYRRQELEHQHRLKVKKQTRRAIGIVIGFLLLTFGILGKYKRNKQSLEERIKEERYAHEIKQKALSKRLKQSNEALRIQKKETSDLAKKMDLHRRQTEWGHLDNFMNESICNDIVTALHSKQIKREAKSGSYPELQLSEAQLHELSVAVEKHFCGFEKTLTDLYPKISRKAINQCLLYLLNLEDVQIAALLSCDYSTVKRRSAKLKQAFGTEKELRQFVREFVL